MIVRALRYSGDTHTEADIEAGVAAGRFQRWDGDDSTIITEILDTPRKRILLFWLAEGNLRDLEAMTPGILAWGKEHGCNRAQLIGRFGWQRSFVTRLGFRESAVMMEIDL